MNPPKVRFLRDMSCCRLSRVEVGLRCKQPQQLCCAWHHAAELAKAKGFVVLQQFAAHLLEFWPLSDVFFVFSGAGQLSALALVCAHRWAQLPDGAARSAYREEVVRAAQVYRVECGPDRPAAFVATFDVLCEAATGRH